MTHAKCKEEEDSPFLGLFKTLFLMSLPFGIVLGILSLMEAKEFESAIEKVVAGVLAGILLAFIFACIITLVYLLPYLFT
ncbi:MAG: hypothetical protein H5T47_07235 [Archaeoglobi archaeon]|nr:hypothetical protein [Candidatus Mnemosynella bozhongmuii]